MMVTDHIGDLRERRYVASNPENELSSWGPIPTRQRG